MVDVILPTLCSHNILWGKLGCAKVMLCPRSKSVCFMVEWRGLYLSLYTLIIAFHISLRDVWDINMGFK